MVYENDKVAKAVTALLSENKGKRKFKQSVDIAVNFRDVDFNKPENRITLEVVLPFAPRPTEVAVFADGQLAVDIKKLVPLVISGEQIPSYAADKKKQKELLKYSLLSQTQLMAAVGKSLGQVLGSKGKLPKPIMPNANLADVVEKAKRSVTLRTKGKYLPVVHCIVGNEELTDKQLTENITVVLDAIKHKVPEGKIKTIYIKTTMGKPVAVAA
ncbi:MAG: 50S ribosomal protein L1 [Candidatus Micrarchaeia archaeon]